jgi:hypothetical protein
MAMYILPTSLLIPILLQTANAVQETYEDGYQHGFHEGALDAQAGYPNGGSSWLHDSGGPAAHTKEFMAGYWAGYDAGYHIVSSQ